MTIIGSSVITAQESRPVELHVSAPEFIPPQSLMSGGFPAPSSSTEDAVFCTSSSSDETDEDGSGFLTKSLPMPPPYPSTHVSLTPSRHGLPISSNRRKDWCLSSVVSRPSSPNVEVYRGAAQDIFCRTTLAQIPQSPSISSSSSSASSLSIVLSGSVLQCTIDRNVNSEIGEVIRLVQPNTQSEAHRSSVMALVETLIRKTLGAKIFPYGSFALKTYLPDSDINVCAFFTHNHQKTWYQRAMKALSRDDSSCGIKHRFPIHGAEFVSTTDSGKVIRAQVADYTFQICANVPHVLSSCALFEEVDRLVGKNHLFKRAILLTKAWSAYDAKVLDAPQGLLSSYVIRSMVLFIFNAYHMQIDNPLQALILLFQYLVHFDWDAHAFGLFGPIQLSSLPAYESVVGEVCAWPYNSKPLISKTLLSRYAADPVSMPPMENTFAGRTFNVIDPRNPVQNLGASLTRKAAIYIRDQLTDTARRALAVISSWQPSTDAAALVGQLLPGTLSRYGSSYCQVDAAPVFDADLGQIVRHILQAGEFDMPDINERDLVQLVVMILKENDGVVTVGKMGSLMHSATNNHSLPAMLKTRYGGLKKLLRRHENIFALASDHPHNPHVMLLPGYESALSHWIPQSEYLSRPRSPSPAPSTKSVGHQSSLLAPIPLPSTSQKSIWSSSLPPRPASVPVHSSVQHSSWTGADDTFSVWSNTVAETSTGSSWLPSLPDEFYCPISGEVMRDPVIAQDGVTYERSSLEGLRQLNRAFSPLTGLPLDLTAVYPNLALKALLVKIRSDELVLTSRPAATISRIGHYEQCASIWG